MNVHFPPFSPFRGAPNRCTPGDCHAGNRNNTAMDVNTTMWEILPLLNTTHVFVNLGWEHLFGMSQQSKFSCGFKSFERHHPDIQTFLISHPPEKKTLDNPSIKFNESNLECDVNVLDRTSVNKNVPAGWYWDNLHVLSILNEEYNHRLIEKICPL